MELKIGETLRRLRREKDLTQEEVAAHLGISFQAVSKWERGDGYPDITMLPALAHYFGVTVDRLIGMDEITNARKLEEIHRTWAENRTLGKHADNVGLMRTSLKQYPNDALLLVQLSAFLERLEGTAAEKQAYLKESIAVQEQILRYCEDSEIRGAVLANISDTCFRFGDREKAMEYARKLPNLYKTRETALVRVLEDPMEKEAAAKSAIEPLAWLLAFHLTALAETTGDAEYRRRIPKLFDILFAGQESDFIRSVRCQTETGNRS